METLKELVANVRIADRAFIDGTIDIHTSKDEERKLWKARQQARGALGQALYEATGVNIHDLKEMIQT